MIKLYAQPYDISARGFYFGTAEEYDARAAKNRNDWGGIVEEYEIQFIDGDDLDAELFRALSVHQGSFARFLDACDEWDEQDKIKVILAVGEAGYKFDLATDAPGDIDVDIYECDNLRDLARQFVDEGLFGDIPARIQNYVDYDAIAYELCMEYSEITLANKRYVHRCG